MPCKVMHYYESRNNLRNSFPASVYTVMPMTQRRPEPRETLAVNLRMLMRRKGWTESDLSRASSVNQKTINNLLNERHPPKLDTVQAVATAFGLQAWHLIMPNLEREIEDGSTVGQLFDAYASASREGREIILRIAEREATYHKNAEPPPPEAASK